MPSDPAFEIAGPVEVSFDGQGVSVDNLGRTDGEELSALDVTFHSKPIFTDEGGRVPAEVIHLGMTGLLTMQLIKWDRLVLQALWGAVPRSALPGDAHLNQGDVGRLWSTTGVAAIGFFGITLIPDLTDTRTVYTFSKCYLAEDGIREAQIGNDATVLRLSFIVLPDGTNDLYAKTVTS